MSNTESTILLLKNKLGKLEKERNEFLTEKILGIQNLILNKQSQSKEYNSDQNSIVEDLKDIDREVEVLEHVIKNSVSLAFNLIKPVKEKEKIISNITGLVDLLKVENQLKQLLNKIKNEKSKNSIENKISIIFEANTLIKINKVVFSNYRELFLKESADVLNYLTESFKDYKTQLNLKTNEEKVSLKECNRLINEMDKITVLTYKLTNDIKFMNNFFEVLCSFIIKIICSDKINEFSNVSKETLSANDFEKAKEILTEIEKLLIKIMLKTSHIINERKINYLKEFGDYKILYHLIEYMLSYIEKPIESLMELLINISKLMEDKTTMNDNLYFVCVLKSNVIASFENFKFVININYEKISIHESIEVKNEEEIQLKRQYNHPERKIVSNLSLSELNVSEISNKVSKTSTNSKIFNSLLYDLGNNYTNGEINFIKNKLILLFKEDSKNFTAILEENINAKFDELVSVSLHVLDDFFYILKESGTRAVETKNLQLALYIINNIETIISDDLRRLLDIKISAILMKSSSTKEKDIKYFSKDEPILSNKYTLGNLYLISCFNSYDQCKNNISDLLEKLKATIFENILESEMYDHSKIEMGSPYEDTINSTIKYFKENDYNLVESTLNDAESILESFDDILTLKIKNSFEFLALHIKASVDIINSTNYCIEVRNISNYEINDSFSNKFVEETSKLLKQWKWQLSENAFNKFMLVYTEFVSSYIENQLKLKKYTNYGIVILEKVSKIILNDRI